MRETWVGSLGWEDPLEKGMATHSSILVGEFHGLYSPCDRKEADTTERLSPDFHKVLHDLVLRQVSPICLEKICPLAFFSTHGHTSALGLHAASASAQDAFLLGKSLSAHHLLQVFAQMLTFSATSSWKTLFQIATLLPFPLLYPAFLALHFLSYLLPSNLWLI